MHAKEALHDSSHRSLAADPAVSRQCVRRQLYHEYVATLPPQRLQAAPGEDKVLATLRAAGLKRGLYLFPFGTHKE